MAKQIDEEMENEEIIVEKDGSESNSLNFIQKNSKLIMILSALVIVIIGAFVYLKNKSNEDAQTASLLITRVLPYYESADYQKALNGDPTKTYMGEPVKGLKYIVSEFGGTDQGKVAALYVGNILLSTNNYSEAKEYFEKASNSPSKEIQSGALAGMAGCLETDKKYEEAAKLFEEAALLIADDELQSRYSFYAGLAYEKAGNKEIAEKTYREIMMKSKLSEFAQLAKAGLVRIGTIIE